VLVVVDGFNGGMVDLLLHMGGVGCVAKVFLNSLF